MSATFIDAVAVTYVGGPHPTCVLPAQNVASGKFLALLIRFGDTLIDTVTDTAGNSWQAVSVLFDGTSRYQVFYVPAATANAANVVTVTYLGGTAGWHEAVCLQYTFAPTASPVDVFALTTSGGGGSSMSTAAFTTAQANELAIVALHGLAGFTAGSGYTERVDQSYMGVQDQNFSAVQTAVTASMTSGGSAGPIWIVTFKDSAGGGTSAGLATETDTALALAAKQISAVGLATETDTAFALTTIAGFDFHSAAGLIFGDLAGALTSLAREASVSMVLRVYAVASPGSLVHESGTLTTGSNGRLPRFTHSSLSLGTNYHCMLIRASDGEIVSVKLPAT